MENDEKVGIMSDNLQIVNPSNNVTIATSTDNPLIVSYGNTALNDAFGRLRVSNPHYVFEAQNQYDAQPLIFNTVTSGGGSSSTHLPNESAVNLTVGTGATDYVIRQSKQYLRYQPGKSQMILMTGTMGAAVANVAKRIGYFDNSNGLFFQQTSSALSVVRRSYTGGSVSNTAVDQPNWNIDTMDGNGPSGIELDMTKSQIFIIDLEWLGVGRVRFGFVVDGTIYYCHELLNTNFLSTVYMTTANLPVRYEIANTAVSAGASMKAICCSVSSEGGYDKFGFPFSVGRGASYASVTTRRPVLSIKPRLTFNSITNRMDFDITGIEVVSSTYTSYFEVVLNGTLTDATFNNVDATYSGMQFDIAANAISGGIVLACGYAVAGGPGANATGGVVQKLVKNPLCVNYAASDSDILSIVATSTDTQDPPRAAAVGAVISWQEIR
jgi:hypothetical protein